MGVPIVQVFVAESSLAGLQWSKQDEQLRAGISGRTLRFDPSPLPRDNAAAQRFHYDMLHDHQATVRAPDFGNGDARSASPAPQVVEISVEDGWVSGRVEWSGTNAAGHPQHVLTAYSATFRLPLEAVDTSPEP